MAEVTEQSKDDVNDGKVASDTSAKLNGNSRFFALYRYNPNRLVESASTNMTNVDETGNAQATVVDFLQKEATANKDFSLSVVATSLSGDQETDLRNFIFKRLSKGTMYSGNGNISNIDLRCDDSDEVQQYMCYYTLLRQDNADFLVDNMVDDKTFCSNEYVACFLAGLETGLDLFRSELDKYCSDLLANLEADLSDLNVIVKTFLENWYESVMEYVCRCVQRLGEDTCYLIYVALMNGRLEIDGGDEQTRTDIDRFVESCSLSELLSQNNRTNSESRVDGTSPQSETESMLVDVRDITEDTEYKLKLTLDGDKNILDKHICTKFCEDWGRALSNGYADNPVYLRQIIDNYKLKAIQDMNTLKRLLRQAESDHYALYRCAMFLQNCGNSAVLLRHAKYEDHTLATQDTADVLQVIEEFLKDTESDAAV